MEFRLLGPLEVVGEDAALRIEAQKPCAAGEEINVATGAITDGFFVITAANGDTLRGTYSGNALPGLTGYVVSGPIDGGTGRFAGATGTIVFLRLIPSRSPSQTS